MNEKETNRDATINDYIDAINMQLSEARDFADMINSNISWVGYTSEPKKDPCCWLLEKLKSQLEEVESLTNTLNAIAKFI